jgi:hypothetical protein
MQATPKPDPLPQGDRGIAARFKGDRGIARDPAVILHDDFEADDLRQRWTDAFHAPQIRIAPEPMNFGHGRRALEFTVPRQTAELSNALVKKLPAGLDRIFLRFYSKFDAGFDQVGSSHNGGFLAAIAPEIPLATPGIRADGRNKFIASFENWRGDEQTRSPGHWNVYCYHPAQRSQWGDHFFPSGRVLPFDRQKGDFGPHFVARPERMPELGRWYCLEFLLQANTVGQRDGRIACWVDGTLLADFPNLHLRDDPKLTINHAALDLHIGSNTRRENRKWYDDVVIATDYIGPLRSR